VTSRRAAPRPWPTTRSPSDKDLASAAASAWRTVQVQTPQSPDPEAPERLPHHRRVHLRRFEQPGRRDHHRLHLPRAQRLFNLEGQASDIAIGLEDGATAAVQAAIEPLLPRRRRGGGQRDGGGREPAERRPDRGQSSATCCSASPGDGCRVGLPDLQHLPDIVGQRVRELPCCAPSAPANARSPPRCWARRSCRARGVGGRLRRGMVVAILLNTILKRRRCGTSETTPVCWTVGAGGRLRVGVAPPCSRRCCRLDRHARAAGRRAARRLPLRLGTLRSLGIIGGLLVLAGAAAIGVAVTQDLDTIPLVLCYINRCADDLHRSCARRTAVAVRSRRSSAWASPAGSVGPAPGPGERGARNRPARPSPPRRS